MTSRLAVSAGVEFLGKLLKVLLVFLRCLLGLVLSRLLPEALFQSIKSLLFLVWCDWTSGLTIEVEANALLGYSLQITSRSRMDLECEPQLARIHVGQALANGLVNTDGQGSAIAEDRERGVQGIQNSISWAASRGGYGLGHAVR